MIINNNENLHFASFTELFGMIDYYSADDHLRFEALKTLGMLKGSETIVGVFSLIPTENTITFNTFLYYKSAKNGMTCYGEIGIVISSNGYYATTDVRIDMGKKPKYDAFYYSKSVFEYPNWIDILFPAPIQELA